MTEVDWFWDHITPDMVQLHKVRERVYAGRTEFQDVEVIDSGAFGRCLLLDGKIQSSELDEFIYHETLVHPATISHPNPETVFIGGGGEGATLREVLRHPSVQRVVMVDIDREVIDVCRRYLASFHQGSLDDPRLELHHTDARGYLEASPGGFDVVILDLPEPIAEGPANVLHTREFYELVKERLGVEGIVSLQAGAASWGNTECFTSIVNTLRAVFPMVFPYAAYIPSFASLWGFAVASERVSLLSPAAIDRRVASRIRGGLRFYDGLTHERLFSLPKNLREALTKETKVITEEDPLFIYKP